MAVHTIQIFATTDNPHPLAISQDNGTTWVDTEAADETFTTLVEPGDTVTFAHTLNKDGDTNNISSIQGINPGSFFKPNEKPSTPEWTGTIKSGNTGTEEYFIRYKVTDVPGTQKQDPKLSMKTK